MPFFFGKSTKIPVSTPISEQIDFDKLSHEQMDDLFKNTKIKFGSQEHFNILLKNVVLDMFCASYPNLKFYKRDPELLKANIERFKRTLNSERDFTRINIFLDNLIQSSGSSQTGGMKRTRKVKRTKSKSKSKSKRTTHRK